jgi:hypothetical protein
MLITNLTLVFGSDNGAVLGGYMGAALLVYEIPWDLGHESCRSRRELSEYIKNHPTLPGKMCHFYGVKNRVFFLLHLKGT